MTEKTSSDKAADDAPAPYRVLARKYRPQTFAELIGQEVMVRTLTNAMASGRLAHAFILTGVRGVGKTTTARILARAMNCIGPDGQGEATIEPCGTCEPCQAITGDRHVDVIEMDAASRTGVDDIREIIDGVRYRPVSARYKVYIIDEVHMLSKNAFNALLKTLEEPPEHVKFIFATTEIRKVPVTVLSRCQRFDLRRVEPEALSQYFAAIAGREGATIEDDALALIVRAAEGSVRDGLSLLDQAIAHCGTDAAISAGEMRAMLGLADRELVIDLFDRVMKGELAPALDLLGEMYAAGADPAVVLQDLLELTHWLTRLKLVDQAAESAALAESARARAAEMAEHLSIPALTRTWQMLLKGLGEVSQAPQPLAAAEMVLIRLAYAADLPSPADLVKELTGAAASSTPASPSPSPSPSPQPAPEASGGGSAQAALAEEPIPEGAPKTKAERPDPQSFVELVALFEARREAITASQLRTLAHLVHFEPGRLEFRPAPGTPTDLASRLGKALGDWTGRRWVVSISGEPGEATLEEQAAKDKAAAREEATNHPLVRAALEQFPDAAITAVRRIDVAGADPDTSKKEEPLPS